MESTGTACLDGSRKGGLEARGRIGRADQEDDEDCGTIAGIAQIADFADFPDFKESFQKPSAPASRTAEPGGEGRGSDSIHVPTFRWERPGMGNGLPRDGQTAARRDSLCFQPPDGGRA